MLSELLPTDGGLRRGRGGCQRGLVVEAVLLLGLDDVDHGLQHLLGSHVQAAEALAKGRPLL